MKKFLLVLSVFTAVVSAHAQKLASKPAAKKPTAKPATKPAAKPAAKPVAKTAAKKIPLNNQSDSVSYVLGTGAFSFSKSVGIDKVNPSMVCNGVNDHITDKPSMIPQEAARNLIGRITQNAQQANQPQPGSGTKPVKKTGASFSKPTIDSASYLIGIELGSLYKQTGITNIDTAVYATALRNRLAGAPSQINDTAANDYINAIARDLQEKRMTDVLKVGEQFLDSNQTRPGVKTTASGLQYTVIKEGTGIKPTLEDTFVCHYRGTLLDGREFDASYNRGVPLEYAVKDVIKGWQEGLQLMAVGSHYKFYIPQELGYGVYGQGESIPGGSVLLFEVELLDVKKKR